MTYGRIIFIILKNSLLYISLFLFLCAALANPAYSQDDVSQTGQFVRKYEGPKSKEVNSDYLLYVPKEYKKDGKSWPVILYLHGASLRGTNIARVKRYGLPWKVEREEGFPFIVISPQCKSRKRWTDAETLMGILDEVMRDFNCDPDRIYLTGMSLGGQGTWYVASLYPERFAALAPIAGHTQLAWAPTLTKLPIWVFHGDRDRRCPIRNSKSMVEALKTLGNDVKFTIYERSGHNIVTRAYEEPELYSWFLEHRNIPNMMKRIANMDFKPMVPKTIAEQLSAALIIKPSIIITELRLSRLPHIFPSNWHKKSSGNFFRSFFNWSADCQLSLSSPMISR